MSIAREAVIAASNLPAARRLGSVRQWLRSDENGVFEQQAAKLLERIPLCYRREEIVKQLAVVICANAIEAMIRRHSGRP